MKNELKNEINNMNDKECHMLALIIEEYKNAMGKHPNWPKNMFKQLSIIGEEMGELHQAANQFEDEHGEYENIEIEASQVGAMALRFLVNL